MKNFMKKLTDKAFWKKLFDKAFWKKLFDKAWWKKLFSRETAKKLLVWQKPQKIAAAIAGGVLVLVFVLTLWANDVSSDTIEAIRTCNFADAAAQYHDLNGFSQWLSSGKVEDELDAILPQTEYAEKYMEPLNQLTEACCLNADGAGGTVLRYWNALAYHQFASAGELLAQMDGETAVAQKKSGAQALTEYVLSHSYAARAENELVSSAAMQNYADCEAFFKQIGDGSFNAQVLPQIKQMLSLGNYEKYNPIYGLFKATQDSIDEADERLHTGVDYLAQGDAKSAKAYFNSAVTLLQEAEAICAEADSAKVWVEDYSAAVTGLSEAAAALRDQALADGFGRMTDYDGAQKVYHNIRTKIIGIITEVAALLPTN